MDSAAVFKYGTPKQFLPPNSDAAETTTTWTSPRIVEIALGAEINSYACAELN